MPKGDFMTPRVGTRGGPKGFRLHPTPEGKCASGCGRLYQPGRGSKGRCPACSRKAQRAAKPRIAAVLEGQS